MNELAARIPIPLRVVLWMTSAALGYGGMIALYRHLSGEMDVYVVLFWRYFAAVALFLPWLIRNRGAGLKTERLFLHLGRAALMVAHGGTLIVALMMIPLAEATSLIFTTPLFATLLAIGLLGERVGPRRWLVLAVGFAGVLVILRPGAVVIDPAAALVLISALTGAAVVVIGKMLLRTESPELTVFYMMLFCVPFAFIPAAMWWQWPTLAQVPWLLALGVLANIYVYSLTRALQIADTSLVMPFDFLRMPAAAAAGFLFFGELIDPWVWLGAAIILASSIYITSREMQTERSGGTQ